MSRLKIKYRTVGLLFIGLALLARVPLAAALEDGIIAVVNDEVITLKDLHDYIRAVYVQMKSEGVPVSEIKAAMTDLETNGITQLIENKIILNEANRLKIDATPEMIDSKFAKIKQTYPSEQDFLDALIANGATPNDLRKKVIEQIKIHQTIEKEVRAKIYVNPQEVTEYYKKHSTEYFKPERAQVDSIFIKKGEDPAKAKEKIMQAFAKLKNGTDFVSVAKEFSDAPSIGIISRGQLLADVEKTIFQLTENGLSDITEVPQGFYIFRLNRHLSAESESLEDVKDRISAELFQDKFRKKYRDWVDKLKSKAFIDIKTAS